NPKTPLNWKNMGTISNRLDFTWDITNNLSTRVGVRNIYNFGSLITDNQPYISESSASDIGKIDLTFLIHNGISSFLYSNIDRANFKFSNKNLEITVGRQRINWGLNLIWNPNDIFNAFNHFDFDYVERPGCDALHIQYYTGMTSSLQFAIKMDHLNQYTYALMYKFNKWDYDFQMFTGVLDSEDYVVGFGWSGQIYGAAFMGEFSYFKKKNNPMKRKDILVGSVSMNYTFKNSLFIQLSYLFNSGGTNDNASDNQFLFGRQISAKNFTKAMHSIFAQASYPITPLINADFSVIYNPGDQSKYFGPSGNFSLSENLDLGIICQIFTGKNSTEFGDYGSLYYLKLKYTF
ncbi:MAG: hypothetical protein MI862_28160, partial [Desulfobacterales bacterium]|nr:hypothetical protein [Desulfobacterales bacterium]